MQEPWAPAPSNASSLAIERGSVPGQPLPRCGFCQRTMTLRAMRDYGLPSDLPRCVTRVVWWECTCGHREVLTQTVLS
jgi:hypothetical protein